MGISVNGIEISRSAIEQEIAHHPGSSSPWDDAAHTLILRELLRQEAQHRGMDQEVMFNLVEATDNPSCAEDLAALLLDYDIQIPTPTEEECTTYYNNNPQRFRSGEMVEASHILFKVDEGQSVDKVRSRAEMVLQETLAEPERFSELAHHHSDCPSKMVGGNLGQFGHGQMVPEFEAAAFALQEGETSPTLVQTRFGLHIVRVEHRIPGRQLPLEAAKSLIAAYLSEGARRWAISRFLHGLVAKADIQGYQIAA